MRLVTFGCSYTNGNYIDYESLWPSVLSRLLKATCVNKGVSGAGNLEILWNILNFEFKPDDIVVVMWSHFSRDHIFNKNGFTRIRESDDDLTRHWALTHSEHDVNIRNWLTIHHADLYIKQFAKVYHILGGDPHLELDAKPTYIKIDTLLDIVFENFDLAPDNHPGRKSHKILAEKIYSNVKVGEATIRN